MALFDNKNDIYMTHNEQLTEAIYDYINYTELWLKDRDAWDTLPEELQRFIDEANEKLLIIKLISQHKIETNN